MKRARGPREESSGERIARGTAKSGQLADHTVTPGAGPMTTDQGVPVRSTDDSLKAGARGPTLMEDFHLREKLTHFDHERIPERVVHARGSGAHGWFRVYAPLPHLTKAAFLQDPAARTPVFVRFSTVVGSRGSADTARDVRGFAVKFYTQEGNFDLVGNNMPVFFIQDGIKFPDLVHAIKPEPGNEIPQASSAHDTFWDFVSLVPETAHMVMWVMSDRAIPRSLRMMEGFGVHTFRLIDARGGTRLVKFHWKPVLGTHALLWDEAQALAGKDADFHRRDLHDAIESGVFPQWDLGLQIVAEEDALAYGFDMLDPTKLLPEEVVPVQLVGRLTLDRNPADFFAEVEQAAFHAGNLVPGIGVTNDPLLQARLFSYLDTQLLRLGGPNFAEIPVNRPVVPVVNHQQDGLMRQAIGGSSARYHPNSVGGGLPPLARAEDAYVDHDERVDGAKLRARSESFADHTSQARLYFVSLTPLERDHIVQAFRFELSNVRRREIRVRVLELLQRVDADLARRVAATLGEALGPSPEGRDAPAHNVARSPALSMFHRPGDSIDGRVIAILAADGVAGQQVAAISRAVVEARARATVVAPRLGRLASCDETAVEATALIVAKDSIHFDAVVVPGGRVGVDLLLADHDARRFVAQAYSHAKTIGGIAEGGDLVRTAMPGPAGKRTDRPAAAAETGVIVSARAGAAFLKRFLESVAQHRHWQRLPAAPE